MNNRLPFATRLRFCADVCAAYARCFIGIDKSTLGCISFRLHQRALFHVGMQALISGGQAQPNACKEWSFSAAKAVFPLLGAR
jgi:hypothetical protein